VVKARAERLEGTLFNSFIWGGFLLLAWPEQRVFIDGGTDHYGDKLFEEYVQVWNLDPGWREIIKRRSIDMALVPPQSRLADELVRDENWTVWYCDSTAALLRKSTVAGTAVLKRTAQTGPCGAITTGSR